MVGVALVAVPGRVPIALDLLLQPWGIAAKLLLVWMVALTVQAVLGLWLRLLVRLRQEGIPLAAGREDQSRPGPLAPGGDGAPGHPPQGGG